jgi:hypothetical protein
MKKYEEFGDAPEYAKNLTTLKRSWFMF